MSTSDSHSQLLVSIQLCHDGPPLPPSLSPFVYGSHPLLGSWDISAAVLMLHVSDQHWELDFLIPPSHGGLEFKFVLKDNTNSVLWTMEEDAVRLSIRDNNQELQSLTTHFQFPDTGEKLCLLATVQLEVVSTFSLAVSWRAQKIGEESQCLASSQPKHDLATHGVHIPYLTANVAIQHPADMAEGSCPLSQPVLTEIKGPEATEVQENNDRPFQRSRSVSVQDLVVLGSESPKNSSIPTKTIDICAELKEFTPDGRCRNSSSDPLLATADSLLTHSTDLNQSNEKDLSVNNEDEAKLRERGFAPLLSDQLLVPKERRRLAIVMVGLPARGKSFTAGKLTRYLRWLGHVTKHFNVGKYRRLKHGCNQSSNFFRPDNPDGVEARNEVAALAMEDMLQWMQQGGQIGIFDATNSTRERRKMLLRMAEGECKVIFLEIICNDQEVIDRNIRLKIQQSPDYVDVPDFDEALKDFKDRLANYEKAYEPVAEGSYIKMIDTVRGEGGQLQINDISGYLPGRIVFFLVNTHTNPRPILLTRPGESLGNIQNRVGGDQCLSDLGEQYAKRLAAFVNKRLLGECTASVWTSTLQRTISTVQDLIKFPKVEWRALDDITAGVCDGMTYQEIKEKMPEEYEARRLDKLRYRYPRGESYLDVIQRLEPVIIELERQQSPVVIVAHQAVLRSLYGYFADIPVEEIPYIQVPLHTVIEIQMGLSGIEEKRYKLL